jgi:multiple sugar transport system permease protein
VAIDGASWRLVHQPPDDGQHHQITALFSLIVTFANFDIAKVLINGGPVDQTHTLRLGHSRWAFGETICRSKIGLAVHV